MSLGYVMKHAHMRTNKFPLKSDHFKRKGDPFASIFFLGPCSGGVHTWNIHTWFIFLKTSPLFCFNYFPPAENNNWPDKNGSSSAFFFGKTPPRTCGFWNVYSYQRPRWAHLGGGNSHIFLEVSCRKWRKMNPILTNIWIYSDGWGGSTTNQVLF